MGGLCEEVELSRRLSKHLFVLFSFSGRYIMRGYNSLFLSIIKINSKLKLYFPKEYLVPCQTVSVIAVSTTLYLVASLHMPQHSGYSHCLITPPGLENTTKDDINTTPCFILS